MHSALTTCVLALFVLLTVQRPAEAQASTDTTTRSDTSLASSRDSATRQGPDTSRAASVDTAAARSNPPAQPTPQGQPTPPAPSAPPARAQAGTRAPGLLLVMFSDSLTEKQRLAVARSVGGRLAGAAATGGTYVQVPADPAAARMAADSLIRTLGVLQVTERSCPTLVPNGR
jgi:hypothetical protein